MNHKQKKNHTDALNFSINVFNDGKLVSIVAVCSAHGSHVAGIIAAYDPQHPEE